MSHRKSRNLVDPAWVNCLLLLLLHAIGSTDGACNFPSDITGTWVRGRDTRSLTFTSSKVTGLGIKYVSNDLGPFTCEWNSGNRYVVKSNTYGTSFGDSVYYICWELVKVTSSAYLFYDLSDIEGDTNHNGMHGHVQSATDPFNQNAVCSKSASTELFTTLIKNGATTSDVAVNCPSPLLARFSYSLCPSDSQLHVCDDSQTLVVNYTLCATPKLFNSNGGTLSCMGDVTRGANVYINLYKHDAGNGVTCFKIQGNGGGSISGDIYSGDCTTSSSQSLTLTKTGECREYTASTSSPIATWTSAADNTTLTESDDPDDTAVIAGAVVGSLLLLTIAGAVIAFIVVRKMKSTSVSAVKREIPEDIDNSTATTEKPDATANGVANGVPNGITAETPRQPAALAPLGSGAPMGEPLRS